MSSFFLTITGDLLLTMFNNSIFEIVSISFLLCTGLSLLQLLKHTL